MADRAVSRIGGSNGFYTRWLAHGDHRAVVAAAYQQVCRELVAFHRLAGTLRDELPPLGTAIVAVAAPDAPLPLVDDAPRLIIDDRARNASFTKNGHLAKLRGPCGVFVQMVQGVDDFGLAPRAASQRAQGGLRGRFPSAYNARRHREERGPERGVRCALEARIRRR